MESQQLYFAAIKSNIYDISINLSMCPVWQKNSPDKSSFSSLMSVLNIVFRPSIWRPAGAQHALRSSITKLVRGLTILNKSEDCEKKNNIIIYINP